MPVIAPQSDPTKQWQQDSSSGPSGGVSLSGIGSDVGLGLGIYGNLEQGGTVGDARAAVGAGQLGAKLGAFGSESSAIGSGLGAINEAYQIYSGIASGKPMGYVNAGVNAARLATQAGAFGGAAGTLGAVAGYAAVPLALYNFAENWRSGKTGSDALSGAEAGASIGSVILPGIGTLAGAVIGGAVGAVSSAFGPGAEDPENVTWDNYAKVFHSNPKAVNNATPSQNFQSLTGIFDTRGSSIPFYNKYGRMGEAKFTTDMMGQVNDAFKSGKITSSDTPQSIYQKIVQPWITSMSPNGWQDANTVQGIPTKAAVGNMLTNLIGQYMQGQLTSQTRVGVSGQTLPDLPAFAGNLAGGDPSGMSGLGKTMTNPAGGAPLTIPQGMPAGSTLTSSGWYAPNASNPSTGVQSTALRGFNG